MIGPVFRKEGFPFSKGDRLRNFLFCSTWVDEIAEVLV